MVPWVVSTPVLPADAGSCARRVSPCKCNGRRWWAPAVFTYQSGGPPCCEFCCE